MGKNYTPRLKRLKRCKTSLATNKGPNPQLRTPLNYCWVLVTTTTSTTTSPTTSKKQTTVALSSCEAEFNALFRDCQGSSVCKKTAEGSRYSVQDTSIAFGQSKCPSPRCSTTAFIPLSDKALCHQTCSHRGFNCSRPHLFAV